MTLGLVVALVALAIFLIWINLRALQPNNSRPAVTDTLEDQPTVTSASFEPGKGLELVSNTPLTAEQALMFLPENKWLGLDDQLNLVDTGTKLPNPVSLPVEQIHPLPQGAILNQMGRTTVYQEGRFQNLAADVSWVTPLQLPDSLGLRSLPGYVYLRVNGNNYNLVQAEDLSLNKNARIIARITPAPEYKMVELRVFNQQPYLFLYESPTRQGKIEIWSINTRNQLTKVQTLSSVVSLRFGSQDLLYTTLRSTPTELSLYDTSRLSFRRSPEGVVQLLDISSRVGQQGIYGTILAHRCTFGLAGELFCLVKQNKTLSTDFTQRDRLIKLDFDKDEISQPFENLVFSASSLHISRNGLMHIVGQENRLLYRLQS